MSAMRARGAADLLRSAGLLADGPVVWGAQVRSRAPGVYLVELPQPVPEAPLDEGALRVWVDRVPTLLLDGTRPTPHELAGRLAAFWLPTESVVYVGRSSGSIGGRVQALYRTPLGDRRPYAGGHWLKTLRVLERLRVWWAETDAPEEYEDALLTAFAEGAESAEAARLPDPSVVLPFANLETATGERKAHGISGALLADDPTRPAPPAEPAVRAPRGGDRRARAAAPRSAARRRTPAARDPRPGTAAAARERPAPAPTYLSRDGLEQLRTELAELAETRRPEIVARIKAAKELGDLRENADYEAARNEQSFNEGRIQALEALLKNTVVVEEPGGGAEVRLGSTVLLERGGETETYTIVGSTEANPGAGRVSYISPVGRALMGRRAGDEVVVRAPAGELRYRVSEVR